MIKFRCSHCNKKFGVPDDYAGRRIRCNTCDHHTMVPKITCGTAAPGCAANSDSDDDIVLSLSENDAPAVSGTPAQNTAPDIQLQSFHRYSPSDSVVAGPKPKPAAKNSVSELLKRCRPDPRTDRTELALNTLSYISCIGPIIFIAMFFYFLMALARGDSPHGIAFRALHPTEPNVAAVTEPNVLAASEPNAVSTAGSIPTPAAPVVLKFSFYVFGLGVSPLAMIASLVLVFRYSYDMPKTLYFSIVIHGLIFFNIFRG